MSNKNGEIKKMMIILSKATLENVYAAFILANGARMEGIEAEMFFTFFGLEAIHKKKLLASFYQMQTRMSNKLCGHGLPVHMIPKPVDEQNLKNIVLFGAVPSFGQMVQALQRRFRK